MNFCTTQTKQGEYRCAFRVDRVVPPLTGRSYAAKPSQIFLFKPDGTQTEFDPTVHPKHFGGTRDEAVDEAREAFREWAMAQDAR